MHWFVIMKFHRISPPSCLQALSLAAAIAATWPARSQTAPTGPTTAPSAAPSAAAAVGATPVERVVVTGNPLGTDQLAQPSSVLAGDQLTLRRASTLGETLDGLPGVASTWFGPNSNRPTIRGLDGDRVRMLDNAGAAIDASNLSFDHAVALDPLVVERVEVLRGPASLLYGGNATGGVVNTLDNRIPRDPLDGVGGRAEFRLGGAAGERSGAAVVEAGQGGFNWHADGFARKTDDLRVPRFTPLEGDEALPATTRVRNSAAEAHGGAVGASWADSRGFAGASVDTYRNDYGVTAEPDVTIQMKRDRLALAAERQLDGPIEQLSLRFGDTRYQHQEIEGTGEVGTTFKSTGQDLRIEARHAPVGGVRGVIGLQAESMSFSALGEEAFVPGTRTRSAALFALEEARLGSVVLTAGLRGEQARVKSDGDAADAQTPRFGEPQERRFNPFSASLSALWPLAAGWSVSGTLGHTERAPAYYELYADGVHVATGAYERGDPGLGVERSQHADLGLQWKSGADLFKANAYTMHFSRFISLEASGQLIEVEGDNGAETVPEYVFKPVRARLWGLEVSGRKRLLEGAWTLDADAGLDLTRGTDLDSGQPLPRISPLRASLGLEAASGPWQLGAGLRHVASQDRVPATDIPTGSYTMLNLWLSRQVRLAQADALWYVKLDNLTDALGYSAGAIRTVRALSPLPGRSVSAGLRVNF